MTESRTFQITLNPKAYQRLKRLSDKIDCKPEEFFLFLALYSMKNVERGKHHIVYYKKLMLRLKNEKEIL